MLFWLLYQNTFLYMQQRTGILTFLHMIYTPSLISINLVYSWRKMPDAMHSRMETPRTSCGHCGTPGRDGSYCRTVLVTYRDCGMGKLGDRLIKEPSLHQTTNVTCSKPLEWIHTFAFMLDGFSIKINGNALKCGSWRWRWVLCGIGLMDIPTKRAAPSSGENDDLLQKTPWRWGYWAARGALFHFNSVAEFLFTLKLGF